MPVRMHMYIVTAVIILFSHRAVVTMIHSKIEQLPVQNLGAIWKEKTQKHIGAISGIEGRRVMRKALPNTHSALIDLTHGHVGMRGHLPWYKGVASLKPRTHTFIVPGSTNRWSGNHRPACGCSGSPTNGYCRRNRRIGILAYESRSPQIYYSVMIKGSMQLGSNDADISKSGWEDINNTPERTAQLYK